MPANDSSATASEGLRGAKEGANVVPSPFSPTEQRYKKSLIAILLAILAFNMVDRLALGLVLQDIKAELELSDTQLGLMTGLAFALFYSVMGIPIARWADRGNRVTIIAVTTGLWSAAVMLLGLATSFVQLLMVRVLVAIGEAGCTPPAHSLIADTFARSERPKAFSVYMLGGPLSLVVGYFAAGWINEFFGWRTTFLLLGLPGIILAGVAWFLLKEPRLERANAANSKIVDTIDAPPPPLREVMKALWSNRAFRHLLLCLSVSFFFGYGILQWKPAFFIRSFGLQTGELGTWFAVIYGIGGVAGTYFGGVLALRFAQNNEALQLKGMAVVYLISGAISPFVYLASNHYLAFGLMALTTLMIAAANGPLFATIQTLVPDRMRASAIALVYLFANLIGLGLGPLAAGALSDLFYPWAGDQSLRYALVVLSPGYCWCTWHFWRASKTVEEDIRSCIGEHRGSGAEA